MDKYKIDIQWSEEDQVFIVAILELPGCKAHGKTVDLALENIENAVDLWLETAKEFGHLIPSQFNEHEFRRALFLENYLESKRQLERGEFFSGTVGDVIKALNEEPNTSLEMRS